jgi:hypothetical protein
MNVDELIRSEVAHAIAHEDDPLPEGVVVAHPNRTVLSARLAEDECRLLRPQPPAPRLAEPGHAGGKL